MPWFNYNYPGLVTDPNSYTLSPNKPSCVGDTICAIYAQATSTVPAQPVITQGIQEAINKALNGEITEDITVLRPASGL
jgi:hypothetical protein